MRLWQDMMKFWPATFEGEFTQPHDILVSHSGAHACLQIEKTLSYCNVAFNAFAISQCVAGMRDMAQELFTDLRPFLSEASTRRQHITFGIVPWHQT